MRFPSALLAGAFLVSACASLPRTSTRFERPVLLSVTEGATTDEIRTLLGEPEMTQANSDGSEQWNYPYPWAELGQYPLFEGTESGEILALTFRNGRLEGKDLK